MTDKLDEDLDELLAGHLRVCLDAQRGRASAAFAEELRARGRWRLWATAAASLAACVAITWIAVVATRPSHPTQVVDTGGSPSAVDEPVTPVLQSATWSRMMDDGAALVDGQPVRQLRRNVVEEIEWYDAKDGAVVRTTRPQQQVFLIGLQAD
jgi:hypothetical protein